MLILVAFALGLLAGATYATGRIHTRRCAQWISEMRAAAMAPAFVITVRP